MQICAVNNYAYSKTSCANKNISAIPNFSQKTQLKDMNFVSFCGFKPPSISYLGPIKRIEKYIKTLHVKPDLMVDASERNFLIATEIGKYFSILEGRNVRIPKMSMSFNGWEYADFKKETACIADLTIGHNKPVIDVLFKTPLYKHKNEAGKLFRSKQNPIDTTLELDFYHEFAHAHQGYFNTKTYQNLMTEQFDEETCNEILEKISSYATSNKSEFVAEYFAYAMTGKEIKSEKLAKLYEECKGPEFFNNAESLTAIAV